MSRRLASLVGTPIENAIVYFDMNVKMPPFAYFPTGQSMPKTVYRKSLKGVIQVPHS